MKVKELIERLQKCDPEALVAVASDPEGNSHGTLYGIATDMAFKDSEVGCQKLTDELREKGYCEEDLLDGEPCIILQP